MSQQEIEILLVEDTETDVELTLHTLRKEHLANRIALAREGKEALDFLFCRGAHSGRSGQPRRGWCCSI